MADIFDKIESQDIFDVEALRSIPPQPGLPGAPSRVISEIGQPEVDEEGKPFPVGATIGGTVGAILAAPFTPIAPLAIPAGAGLGAMAGEAGEQLIRRGFGMEGVPQTSEEAAKRIGTEGAIAAIAEPISRIGLKAAGKVFRAIKPRPEVTPEAERAIKFLDENLPEQERSVLNPFRYIKGKEVQKKLTLLPAEATESRSLDMLHNVSENAILGGNTIDAFKKNRAKALANIADDIVTSFGDFGSADDIGELFVRATNGELKMSRVPATIMYNTVTDLAKNTKVSIKSLKQFGSPLLDVAEELQGVGAIEAGDDILASIASMGDDISFEAAQELRSRLINKIDAFSVTNPKAKAIGKSRKLIGLMDNSIENSLKKDGQTEALRIFREANRLWKEGSSNFDNKFIRGLIRVAEDQGNPELIVQRIFKDKAVSNIKRAKTAVGGIHTNSWKRMQGIFTENLITKSTTPGTKELTGKRMLANIDRMGKQALREIYTPGQLNKVKEFANALDIVQAKQAEGTGKMFIQLTQAGAILAIPTGRATGSSAAILLAPAVLAKAFTNPKIANVLIQGIKAGEKSKIAAGAMGRFVTDLTNYERDLREQGEKEDGL